MEHLFLIAAAVTAAGLLTGCGRAPASFPLDRPSLWKDNHCRQETVDVSRLEEGVVRARVDGRWREFRLCGLPKGFLKWSLKRRMELMEGKAAFFLGAHCGLVATYGCPRSDSEFHINNAAKGVGFLPLPDRLAEVNRLVEEGFAKSAKERHALMRRLYENFDRYFDKTRLVSLELYTRPDFETQTFINQMTNPACSIVFLDMTSYELKAISHLLHPADPRLSAYQKEVVRFANLMHGFGHGARREPSRDLITVIYYVVEAYDNSPRGPKPGGRVTSPADSADE